MLIFGHSLAPKVKILLECSRCGVSATTEEPIAPSSRSAHNIFVCGFNPPDGWFLLDDNWYCHNHKIEKKTQTILDGKVVSEYNS